MFYYTVEIGGANLVAYFDEAEFTVTASADPAQGSVTGGGKYRYGTTVTLTASPAYGYKFKEWHDGAAETVVAGVPSRTFTLTQDTLIKAIFEERDFSLTVRSNNGVQGTVVPEETGVGHKYRSSVDIKAVPKSGYAFDYWLDENGNKIATQDFSCQILGDTTFVVYFKPAPIPVHMEVNDLAMGSITPGTGYYPFDSVMTITAVPNPGYKLCQWHNGSQSESLTYQVIAHDSLFKATFCKDRKSVV